MGLMNKGLISGKEEKKVKEVKEVPEFDTETYPIETEELIIEDLSKEHTELLKKALMKTKSKPITLQKSEKHLPRFNILLDETQKEELELLTILLSFKSKSALFVDYLDSLRFEYGDLIARFKEEIKKQ